MPSVSAAVPGAANATTAAARRALLWGVTISVVVGDYDRCVEGGEGPTPLLFLLLRCCQNTRRALLWGVTLSVVVGGYDKSAWGEAPHVCPPVRSLVRHEKNFALRSRPSFAPVASSFHLRCTCLTPHYVTSRHPPSNHVIRNLERGPFGGHQAAHCGAVSTTFPFSDCLRAAVRKLSFFFFPPARSPLPSLLAFAR